MQRQDPDNQEGEMVDLGEEGPPLPPPPLAVERPDGEEEGEVLDPPRRTRTRRSGPTSQGKQAGKAASLDKI